MDETIRKWMLECSIDPEMTSKILATINSPGFHNCEPVKVTGIPSFDGKTVIDVSGDFRWTGNYDEACENLEKASPGIKLPDKNIRKHGRITLERSELEEIGLRLLPCTALGILNGGSATSYADILKNSSFNTGLFESNRPLFEEIAEKVSDLPKGIAPAYINRDHSDGFSFAQLKMRSILLKIRNYIKKYGKTDFGHPLFQMTSCGNNSIIAGTFRKYASENLTGKLMDETGVDLTNPPTGIQPMVAAFTHSSYGKKREIFTEAYGENGRLLPLPGGHGQNFQVLKDIYLQLHREGKNFVYLGNVDNIGYNIDLAEVAVLALSGSQAAFDFSFRTPVDVKGGILVYDETGRINCVDIGPAISASDVEREERKGSEILFNCATGLFSLDYLTSNIDLIIDNLPLRLSDQEKDAGRYSQAEQTTWEIIGLLDDFKVFGVDKYKRFLASKLLMENLLISRPESIEKYFSENPGDPMNSVSKKMNSGLVHILENEMELSDRNGKWG